MTWEVYIYIPRWWFQSFFYFQPYLEKWSNLTNIFQMGWNHHLDTLYINSAIRNPCFLQFSRLNFSSARPQALKMPSIAPGICARWGPNGTAALEGASNDTKFDQILLLMVQKFDQGVEIVIITGFIEVFFLAGISEPLSLLLAFRVAPNPRMAPLLLSWAT